MWFKFKYTLGVSAACLVGLVATVSNARADAVYQLDCTTAACNPSFDFGTVTLHQDGSAVDVSVVLNSALGVHFAPAEWLHPAFTWSMADTGDSDSSNLPNFGQLSPGFMSMAVPTMAKQMDYFVRCMECAAGMTNPSTLSFSIAGHSVDDFVKNPGGFFFTANIFSNMIDANGMPFIGRVGSDGGFDPVPEPTFYVALAVGVGALFFTARRTTSSSKKS